MKHLNQSVAKVTGIFIALVLAASCTESGPRTFSSVQDLRNAFVELGGSCPTWIQSNLVEAAEESGDCNSSTVLSTYKDAESAREAAENLADLIRSIDLEPSIAYGGNWVINSNQAPEIGPKLGGTVITD